MAASGEDVFNLGAAQRDLYRAKHHADVAAGTMKPLLLPWDLAGAFIIPMLYLTIPHTKRPWVYRARFLVFAVVIYLNFKMMNNTSSANMAVNYATGLMGSWGIEWAAVWLIWKRPQFEAERVVRRRRSTPLSNGAAHQNGTAGATHTNGSSKASAKPSAHQNAPDESIAKALDEHEYCWQAFPADASFMTRLGWVADLYCAFRGSGWNHSIPTIPRFQKPEKPLSGELVKLDSIPLVSHYGYSRFTTWEGFRRDRLWRLGLSYLVLDFLSVFMMRDPYFVLGETKFPYPLPWFLAALPPWLLEVVRSGIGCLGTFTALYLIFSGDQALRGLLVDRTDAVGSRGDLWRHPTINGGFTCNVLDHGLAGFWGGWWHQTFRLAFSAPTEWLVRHGYLAPRSATARVVGGFVAFAQSGLLHLAGSYTTIPATNLWSPPLFFMLSFAGVLAQDGLCALLKPQIARVPRPWRRAANLAYTALFLHFTRWALVDDLSRCGIWLFEPVPVSPLRAMGFGLPGEGWWRWDRGHWPVWHVGKHWWETGVGI